MSLLPNLFFRTFSAIELTLFQRLLQTLEDKQDIEVADARTEDSQQDLIEFDRFFATLDDEDAPVKLRAIAVSKKI